MPAGRPTDYSPEIVEEICFRIASGASVLDVCADPAMPSHQTIYQWKNKYPEFSDKIARARDDRNEAYADQMRAIGRRVMQEPDLDPQRARAAIDAIDKAARLMNPKTKIEHSGPGGGPIKAETAIDLSKLTDAQLATIAEIAAVASGSSEGA